MPSGKPTLVLTTSVGTPCHVDALKSTASVRSSAWHDTCPHSATDLPSAGLPSAGIKSAGFLSPLLAIKTEEGPMRSHITPPMAYMDFLKATTPTFPSPSMADALEPRSIGQPKPKGPKGPKEGKTTKETKQTKPREPADSKEAKEPSETSTQAPTPSTSTSHASSVEDELPSNPSSASSRTTTCSCGCERAHKSPRVGRINTSLPSSPFSNHPMSAPAMGRTTFPSLKVPVSPAPSNPGRTDSPSWSPFSARSVVSPFDWDAALKARVSPDAKPTQGQGQQQHTCSQSPATPSRKSVRHIREVVTRTVTYTPTPRMHAPPKGKKRKVECDEAPGP